MSEAVQPDFSNCVKRIQLLRQKFKTYPLVKSGFNKHMNFKYFELKDFLPTTIDLLAEFGLTTVMTFEENNVDLHIFPWDMVTDTIRFRVPRVESELKGQKAIQVLGADITYYRRYLYGMLVDLVENDQHDAELGADGKAEPSDW